MYIFVVFVVLGNNDFDCNLRCVLGCRSNKILISSMFSYYLED